MQNPQTIVAALGTAIRRLDDAGGRGLEQSKELLRIVNDQHFARVRGLLDDARAKGAQVAVGGETRAVDRYVAPTVLTGVTEDMRVMQEEIFAPILPVIAWRDRADAIEILRRRTSRGALNICKGSRGDEWFLQHTSAGSTGGQPQPDQSGTNPRLRSAG